MANKVTITSSHIDKHGDSMAGTLAKTVIVINGEHKMRMLINHKRELPPLGFWDNGELVQEGEHFCVKAEENFFGNRELLLWDSNLVKETNEKSVKLINRNVKSETLNVSVDKNNFSCYNDLEQYSTSLKKLFNNEISLDLHTRKAFIPHPELIIKIAATSVMYTLIKPMVKRIGEKIADDFADDIYKSSKEKVKKFQTYVWKTIRLTKEKTIPKNKDLITIFEIPGEPYVELYAKTDDAELISKSLSERKLQFVRSEIERLSNYVGIAEIHFFLNEKGNWKFSFLITLTGEIIGTKKSFDERDKEYKKVLLSPTAGYSVSGGGLQYEKVKK